MTLELLRQKYKSGSKNSLQMDFLDLSKQSGLGVMAQTEADKQTITINLTHIVSLFFSGSKIASCYCNYGQFSFNLFKLQKGKILNCKVLIAFKIAKFYLSFVKVLKIYFVWKKLKKSFGIINVVEDKVEMVMIYCFSFSVNENYSDIGDDIFSSKKKTAIFFAFNCTIYFLVLFCKSRFAFLINFASWQYILN